MWLFAYMHVIRNAYFHKIICTITHVSAGIDVAPLKWAQMSTRCDTHTHAPPPSTYPSNIYPEDQIPLIIIRHIVIMQHIRPIRQKHRQQPPHVRHSRGHHACVAQFVQIEMYGDTKATTPPT